MFRVWYNVACHVWQATFTIMTEKIPQTMQL